MESNLIDVHLSVEIKEEALVAHLNFQNKSTKKVYLDKQTIYYKGEVRNNYFEIYSNDEEEIDYLGMMANCELLPENFVELEPGKDLKTTIQLNEFYKLDKGDKYSIQYYACNPSFIKEQQLMQMESNKVEITY
jgi:hypothetical protein